MAASGNRICSDCFRVEERNGVPFRDEDGAPRVAAFTYRGGVGRTAMLRHFAGACRPKYDALMREIKNAKEVTH